jgi:hypothetical protein
VVGSGKAFAAPSVKAIFVPLFFFLTVLAVRRSPRGGLLLWTPLNFQTMAFLTNIHRVRYFYIVIFLPPNFADCMETPCENGKKQI